MPVVTRQPSSGRVIMRNVSRETYEKLLHDLGTRSSPRLAYDRGILEIMSPHLEHEEANRVLASIVELVLEEIGSDFLNAGSTTFRDDEQERGFEPDSSFYIQNVDRVRGKKRLDMSLDPPPDLLIEVDLSSDSLNKFPLYASLGVPEVWRYAENIEVWVLRNVQYVRNSSSLAVPILNETILTQFMESYASLKRPEWLQQARHRIRSLIRH